VTDYQPGDLFHFTEKCVRYLYLSHRLVLRIDTRPEYRAGRRVPVVHDPFAFDRDLQTMCHMEADCSRVKAMYHRLATVYGTRPFVAGSK